MEKETLQKICAALQEHHHCEFKEFRGEYTFILQQGRLISVLKQLKHEFGFEMLLDITAVDYWPQPEPRFHLIYQVFSINQQQRIQLRVPLDGNAPSIQTAEDVYRSANWYEREVYDLMGITFDGHSDPRRIVMPSDWEGHPLRKDYPLGYEEVQFTFNFDEIKKNKPHPNE